PPLTPIDRVGPRSSLQPHLLQARQVPDGAIRESDLAHLVRVVHTAGEPSVQADLVGSARETEHEVISVPCTGDILGRHPRLEYDPIGARTPPVIIVDGVAPESAGGMRRVAAQPPSPRARGRA